MKHPVLYQLISRDSKSQMCIIAEDSSFRERGYLENQCVWWCASRLSANESVLKPYGSAVSSREDSCRLQEESAEQGI